MKIGLGALGLGLVGTVLLHWTSFVSGFQLNPGPRLVAREALVWCEQANRGPQPVVVSIFYARLRDAGLDAFTALQLVNVGLTFLGLILTVVLLNRVLGLKPPAAAFGAALAATAQANSPRSSLDMIILFWVLLLAVGRDAQRWRAWRSAAALTVAGLLMVQQILTNYSLAWLNALLVILLMGCLLLLARSRAVAFLRWLALPLLVAGVFTLVALLVSPPPLLTSGSGNWAPGPLLLLAWLSLSLLVGLDWRACPVPAAGVLATNLSALALLAWPMVQRLLPGVGLVGSPRDACLLLALPASVGLAWGFDRALQSAGPHWPARAGLVLLGLLMLAQSAPSQVPGFRVRAESAYLQGLCQQIPAEATSFGINIPPYDRRHPAELEQEARLIAAVSGIPWARKAPAALVVLEPPIEAYEPRRFARRLFTDFYLREPQPHELLMLERARPDERVDLALGVFSSPQYFDEGGYLIRLYLLGLGRLPHINEFTEALERLRPARNSEETRAWRQQELERFVAHPEFPDGLRSVEAILKSAGLDGLTVSTPPTEPIQQLFVLAHDESVLEQLLPRTTVALLYYGYLRREPDPGGYARNLKDFEANGDILTLTNSFLNSREYNQRPWNEQ